MSKGRSYDITSKTPNNIMKKGFLKQYIITYFENVDLIKYFCFGVAQAYVDDVPLRPVYYVK